MKRSMYTSPLSKITTAITLAVSLVSVADAATTGTLVIVNQLGMSTTSAPGPFSSATPIKVIVKDAATTPVTCSTTASLAYGGSIVVNIDSTLASSTATACKSVGTVSITPLANAFSAGNMPYVNTGSAPLALSTTLTAVDLAAPTSSSITSYAIVVKGDNVASVGVAASATANAWGATILTPVTGLSTAGTPGTAITFSAANGALVTPGAISFQAFAGIRAHSVLRSVGVMPIPGDDISTAVDESEYYN